MKYVLKRMGEASTMAGVSAAAQALYAAIYMGMPLSVAVPAALAGLFAILKSDTKAE